MRKSWKLKGLRVREKILLSVLGIGVLSSVAALGIFGVFSATTQNTGNEIVSGTVSFTNNSAGSALYSITNAKPGQSFTRCIKATYTGSLTSAVKLYTSSAAGPLAPYVDLTITQGTDASTSFPNCGSFVADTGGQLYNGTLSNFESTYTDYAHGISTGPGSTSATWSNGSAVVYQFSVTVDANTPNSLQAADSGVHGFIWEADNT
jgi:hypothetical protein